MGRTRARVRGHVTGEKRLECDETVELPEGPVTILVKCSPLKARPERETLTQRIERLRKAPWVWPGTANVSYALALVLSFISASPFWDRSNWWERDAANVTSALAAVLVVAAAYCAWRPPLPYHGTNDDIAAAGLARATGDSGVLEKQVDWLLANFHNESQLVWQRFNFFLAIEGVLVAALLATSKDTGPAVRCVAGLAAAALSLIWLHFSRVGGIQVRYWTRQLQFHHEGYLKRSERVYEPLLHWKKLDGALRRTREEQTPPGFPNWFDDCRFPWPGNLLPWGMSRIIELVAWVCVVSWSVLAWVGVVQWLFGT